MTDVKTVKNQLDAKIGNVQLSLSDLSIFFASVDDCAKWLALLPPLAKEAATPQLTGIVEQMQGNLLVLTGTLNLATPIPQATLILQCLPAASQPAIYVVMPLGASWKFSTTYPTLQDTLLDNLSLSDTCFVLSNQATPQNLDSFTTITALQAFVAQQVDGGLNLLATLDVSNSTGLEQVSYFLKPSSGVILTGTIDAERFPAPIMLSVTFKEINSTLVPSISLESFTLDLYSELAIEDETDLMQAGTLSGQFHIGDSQSPQLFLQADLSNDAPLTFEGGFVDDDVAKGKLTLDKVTKELLGSGVITDQLSSIASHFSVFKTLSLYSFSFRFSPSANNNLDAVSFGLAWLPPSTTDSWNIIGDFSISAISFGIGLLNPLSSSPLVSITIGGQLNFWGTQFDLTFFMPDKNFSAHLNVETPIPLSSLLEKIGLALRAGDDLEVIDVYLSADCSGDFSFEIDVAGSWTIVSDLVLEQVRLSGDHSGGDISGSLEAVLEIAGVEVFLEADFSKNDDRLSFQGETAPDQAIHIGDLLTDLATKFNATVKLPAAISDMTIENLSVLFENYSHDFTFTCEGQATIDGHVLDAVIWIDLLKQPSGYDVYFNGYILVNNYRFDLIFDKNQQGSVFIAAYSNPSNHPQNIHDLVNDFLNPNPIPPNLTFTLKDALLAYQSDQKKWLFGLDIDGGLNLSDLHIDDLPLVGALFPPDQRLQLAFQVLVAPKDPNGFSKTDVGALADLLPPGDINLPAQDINGLALNTILRLGGQAIQIPLDMGSDTSLTGGTAIKSAPVNNPPQSQPLTQSSNTPGGGNTQWVKIQKTFGPVHIEQVGIRYDSSNSKITALLNASLTAGGLTIDLQGLKATSPLTALSPTFGLDGLGIAYQNGVIEVAGSFLKMGDQFAGLAVLRAKALSLSAIGAYGKTASGDVSLFLYATLNYPLGGPSFFFVTGLAAGFGYNRALIPPTIDQVASFPLVSQAVSDTQLNLNDALTAIQNDVPISVGQMFFAVGIKFTSFKLIDSFALLVVQFGNRTEIDLLGLSTLIVPSPDAGGSEPSLAEAQLALKATFIADDGFLGVEAQLTSASYLLDRNCHLTGGFAFYSWLKDPHAGDFVLTLGGYHPHFNIPPHYPQRVPRLGINWQVNDHLSITGQEYYALTAHALMAGGSLSADYHDGSVHVWFNAGADFLLTWQPYHYEASLYISLGAEVDVDVLLGTVHLSFDAGADLSLWGPPFGGHADIHLRVCGFKVAFDVDFGSGHSGAKPIAWDAFKKAFLPAENQVCSLTVQHGLLRSVPEGSDERWIVNPQSFALVTNSVIPAQSAHAGTLSTDSTNLPTKIPVIDNKGQSLTVGSVAIQPMGTRSDQLISTHTITITHDGANGTVETDFVYQPVLKQVPSGMWGAPEMDGEFLAKPDVNAASFVENALCGLIVSPKPSTPSGHTHSIDRRNLGYETTNHADTQWDTLVARTLISGNWADIQSKIVNNTARASVLQELEFGTAVIDFGQPVDQFTVSAPQVVATGVS